MGPQTWNQWLVLILAALAYLSCIVLPVRFVSGSWKTAFVTVLVLVVICGGVIGICTAGVWAYCGGTVDCG